MRKTIVKTGLLITVISSIFYLSFANEISRATETQKMPKSPTIIELKSISAGIAIKWNRVDKAKKYRLYRKVGSSGWVKIVTTKKTKYNDKGLNSGVRYKYTVTSVAGKDKESRKSTVKGKMYVGAPLVTLSAKPQGILVSWKKVSGAKRYRVFRQVKGGIWSVIKDTGGRSFLDKKCESGTTYRYRVVCIDSYGKRAGIKSIKKTRRFVACPHIVLNNEKTGVKLTWDKIKGAAMYLVMRKTKNGNWNNLGRTEESLYKNISVASGEKYSYKVKCLNKSENPISADSQVKSKVFVSSPVLTVRRMGDRSKGLELEWQPVRGALKYRIFRMREGGSWVELKDVSDPGYDDSSVSSGIVYYYQVAAVSGDGKRLMSAKSAQIKGMYYKAGIRYTTENTSYLKKEPAGNSETLKVKYMSPVYDKDIIKKGLGVWHILEYNGEEYYLWEANNTVRLIDTRSEFVYDTENIYQRKVLDLALSFIHRKTGYSSNKYGVQSEDGTYLFDCSNFTAYCINQAVFNGYKNLTVNVNWQYENRFPSTDPDAYSSSRPAFWDYVWNGIKVEPVDVIQQGGSLNSSLLEPGDLLFWNHAKGTKTDGTPRVVDHVGIYLGGGEFIHCSSKFGVNIWALQGASVTNFVGAVRFIYSEDY